MPKEGDFEPRVKIRDLEMGKLSEYHRGPIYSISSQELWNLWLGAERCYSRKRGRREKHKMDMIHVMGFEEGGGNCEPECVGGC